ncbi:MAG: nucleoside-diphosphate kinase [Thermotogaceae bacterium]|nr:nucleoside-diphosphate kinase [Thermotogaceae bacterium]MDN5338249.1 nucleoside-diphosphate kinase [Thermotogaceae bacterium]
MDIERTFVYIKPDGVRRKLIGEVISRFEKKGLNLVALKMIKLTREKAEELYKEHVGRDFYEPLIKFITSGPVVMMVLEGPRAVEAVRQVVGSTDAVKAFPGSIRGDFALSVRENVVHASDSVESAEREMKIFFNDDEIIQY